MSIINSINRFQSNLETKSNNQSSKLDLKHRQRSSSFLSNKNRRKTKNYVQVSEFLLGGNVTDPLNLQGLTSKDNKSTPFSSPQYNKEIEVLIPADFNDPLKLNNCESNSELCHHLLISPTKQQRKQQFKRKRTESDSILIELRDDKRMKIDLKSLKTNLIKQKSTTTDQPQINSQQLNQQNNLNKTNVNINCKLNSKDSTNSNLNNSKSLKSSKKPFIFTSNQNSKFYYANGRKFNLKDKKFQFGNYNRYYGKRNGTNDLNQLNDDLRLKKFNKEWFLNKHVLDVGCNVGNVTSIIARDFKPIKITGLDIDSELIKVAKHNIRNYLKNSSLNNKSPNSNGPLSDKINKDDDNKDIKLKDNENNLENKLDDNVTNNQENVDDKEFKNNQLKSTEFPNNINFISANYVLPSDDLLELQKPEYDCILCLSVTKWIHLNFGDSGLKRMFKRIYLQLNENGRLILEPQPFWSYKRRKAITETTLKNYNSIKLKPEMFKDYLLSDEIGFKTCEIIEPPENDNKGFRRSIYVFQK